MSEYVVLLSVPGLRDEDVAKMPRLSALTHNGDRAELAASFPGVTCPVQANMTTGFPPSGHGVVANGFYWRERREVEMWTSPNDCILQPQLWDVLRQHHPEATSAVWFPLHSKGCSATYLCTPAPIHQADGSEKMWCATTPDSLYEELLGELGHFPLHHFWGPLANIESTRWIARSAVIAARRYRPNLFYIYLPHLDYASQKFGPDSQEAFTALGELDAEIGALVDGFAAAYQERSPLWLVASEYVITPVERVVFPNRLLREAGLLSTVPSADGDLIDFAASKAWALADHQAAHIYIRDADPQTIAQVQKLLRNVPGVAEALRPDASPQYDLAHQRSGELVLAAEPDAWFAYPWWFDDAQAPAFARTVDIHRKPGYDP
ncbi:MAG: alkaline phosphatase family protein, partial [Planctomycetales bacterium]|nr:alkaline phosphatase family protein [Planctomycetales bacterium]